LSLLLKLRGPLDVHRAVETGQSLVPLAVALLSEAFAAFATLKRSVIPVGAEMVHHVADFRKVRLADTANEDLVHPLSFLVVDSSARVVKLLRFVRDDVLSLLVDHTSVVVSYVETRLKAHGMVFRLGSCLERDVRAQSFRSLKFLHRSYLLAIVYF